MSPCPACGAERLEDAGHLIRCGQCLAEYDRFMRPYGPMHTAVHVTPMLSDDTMPTMVSRDGDSTHIDLSDELPTDPRQRALAPAPNRFEQFAPPPPPAAPSSPFAPPPSAEALARVGEKKKWAYSAGDGGPPSGLDLLVLLLVSTDLLSALLWWRSDAPVAGCYLIPLCASALCAYFFWQGKNAARFLIMTGSLIEIVVFGLAFAMVRRHMTGPEMIAVGLRGALDVYIVWFCVRPDTVSFFEKRSGRPTRR